MGNRYMVSVMIALCSNMTGMLFAEMAFLADERIAATGKKVPDTYYMRKISTLVYFMHLAIVPVGTAIVNHVLDCVFTIRTGSVLWGLSIGGVTIILSVVGSAFVIFMSKKSGFRWLKYLY